MERVLVAVVEVASKLDTVSLPAPTMSPCTPKGVPGLVVPIPTNPRGEFRVETVRMGILLVLVAKLQALTTLLGIVEVEEFEKVRVPAL